MNIIQVEILSEQGLKLLRQLEKLNILRLIQPERKSKMPKRKWAGSISKTSAERMLEELEKGRDEWERTI
ncbi:MAG TPA: hypothetical protein DIW47_12110 [Bacteroidetes bacterium]|nr:hypothetical protein [Bacteroidota bacterium]